MASVHKDLLICELVYDAAKQFRVFNAENVVDE